MSRNRFTRSINSSLRLETARIMLESIYKDLSGPRYKEIDMSQVKTLEDLYVAYICRAVTVIEKAGLYREYKRVQDVELVSPKGAFNIQKTVQRQSMKYGKMYCSYDELSADILHNQVIKATLIYLAMKSGDNVSSEMKFEAKKSLATFNGVTDIDISKINWSKIRFNNSNIRYKSTIKLCKAAYDSCEANRLYDGTLEEKLYILYKQFLYNYYYDKFPNFMVEKLIIGYENTDASRFERRALGKNIYIKISDVTQHKAVVIGCYMYDTKRSKEKEEALFQEVKKIAVDEAIKDSTYKVMGCCMFCNSTEGYTVKEIDLLNVGGISVVNTTVDLHTAWKFIDFKLNQVLTITRIIENKAKE